jgi:hypothetical protein
MSPKGRRPTETQNAVDAVLVAATFGPVAIQQTRCQSDFVRELKLLGCIKWGQDMKSKEISFVPSETKQRFDCCRLAAVKAVRAFCHSEEGGRDNTDSKQVYRVEDPEDRNIFHNVYHEALP